MLLICLCFFWRTNRRRKRNHCTICYSIGERQTFNDRSFSRWKSTSRKIEIKLKRSRLFIIGCFFDHVYLMKRRALKRFSFIYNEQEGKWWYRYSNSIVMIPPTSLFRVTGRCSNVPIVVSRSSLETRRRFSLSREVFRLSMNFHTLSLQLDNIDKILRQTALILSAGDQSSVNIERQMWPFE